MLNEPMIMNCSCHLNGTGKDPSNLGVLFTQAVASPLLDTVILTTAFPDTAELFGTMEMFAIGGLPDDDIPLDDSIGSRTRRLMESKPNPFWIVILMESSLISGVALQSVIVSDVSGPVMVFEGKTELLGVRYLPFTVR